MTELKFNIYYDFDSLVRDKPGVTKKTDEELHDSLGRVENELGVIDDDPSAKISINQLPEEEKARLLEIESSLSREDLIVAIEGTLNGLELFGKEIKPMSNSEKKKIVLYLKDVCSSPSCEDFLNKFIQLVNENNFSSFLVNEMKVSDPRPLLENLLSIRIANFNNNESECIDSACNEIVKRLSSAWN